MVTNSKVKKTAKTTNRISKVKKAPESPSIIIQPLQIGRFTLEIRGTSPLVTHDFDGKSRQQMLEKQTKTQRTAAKEARCPEEEFLQAIYWVKGSPPDPILNPETGERSYDQGVTQEALKKGTFGMPAAGLQNAIVSACRNTDMAMTAVKQLVNIEGFDPDDPDDCDPTWLIIKSNKLPSMDARICRLSKNVPIERFRPMWRNWSTHFKVEYDSGSFSQSNVINLINIAGFFVGLCEGRPEKCALGWGRFEIV